mgnify:CR=1 FL=1
MIPNKIGDWNVVDELGSGGQGLVLRAKKMQLNGQELEAAIKIPKYDFSKLEEAQKAPLLKSLVHEFEMLELVKSPNVCRVINSGIEAVKRGQKTTELPWLATELIKGDDLLSEVRKNGPLDENAWFQLAWDISSGLEAIHAVGATHLDLKPQNVVRHARKAIVIDLGGASFVGKLDFGDLIHTRTLQYAAPEQLDEKHDPEDYEYPVDLYSLGATLYFAATFEILHHPGEISDKKEYAKARHKNMKSDSVSNAKLSPDQAKIIDSLCRFRPSDRISLAELKKELVSHLPEKDSRKPKVGLVPETNNEKPEHQAEFKNMSAPESIIKHRSVNPDIGGWVATLLLVFLPPLAGPFIRFHQLRNTRPKTSQRYQLRTLLALGSLMSFGALGAFAFFRKYKHDGAAITKITGFVFLALSISLFLSTLIGINLDPASDGYRFMQSIAEVGVFANIFLIAPISSALGVYDPKPKHVEESEANSESEHSGENQTESSAD